MYLRQCYIACAPFYLILAFELVVNKARKSPGPTAIKPRTSFVKPGGADLEISTKLDAARLTLFCFMMKLPLPHTINVFTSFSSVQLSIAVVTSLLELCN